MRRQFFLVNEIAAGWNPDRSDQMGGVDWLAL